MTDDEKLEKRLFYNRRYRENERTIEFFVKMSKKKETGIEDADFGRFRGGQSRDGLLKGYDGKRYIELVRVSQEEIDTAEFDADLRGIYLQHCVEIKDLTVLEKYPNLEFIGAFYAPSLRKLPNAIKLPKLKECHFIVCNKLNIEAFSEFTELWHLTYTHDGSKTFNSFDFLLNLQKLEQLWLPIRVFSNDIRPILQLKNLKNYLLEDKYHKSIERYLKDGTLLKPQAPSIFSDMPTQIWRDDESSSMTKKQIRQIELVLAAYCKAITTAESVDAAKSFATACVKQLNQFSDKIETDERESLYEYLMDKAKDEWRDAVDAVIEETREW